MPYRFDEIHLGRYVLEVVLETLLLEESKGPIPFVDPRLEGEVP